jgi:hypothetical protein
MNRLPILSGFAAGVAVTAMVAALDAVHALTWVIVALGGAFVAIAAVRWLGGPAADDALRIERDLGWRQFHREVIRSRRAAHPLTLLRIAGAGDEPSAVLSALADVRAGLRRADIAWADEHDLYAMLPETAREAAEPVVQRLESLGHAGASVRLAAFPADGLTTGALIAAVEGTAPNAIDVRGPISDQLVVPAVIAAVEDTGPAELARSGRSPA